MRSDVPSRSLSILGRSWLLHVSVLRWRQSERLFARVHPDDESIEESAQPKQLMRVAPIFNEADARRPHEPIDTKFGPNDITFVTAASGSESLDLGVAQINLEIFSELDADPRRVCAAIY